mmetsp:Transcript_12406/g.40534  ORF Transcript_12406/g.40534 Transcript_12406/m.40534 type:complete len:92 (-) Transcript_12406:171-446(-)
MVSVRVPGEILTHNGIGLVRVGVLIVVFVLHHVQIQDHLAIVDDMAALLGISGRFGSLYSTAHLFMLAACKREQFTFLQGNRSSTSPSCKA